MSDLPRQPLSTESEVWPPPTTGSQLPEPNEGSYAQAGSSSDSDSTVDTAKGEAKQVAGTAVDSGKEVAADRQGRRPRTWRPRPSSRPRRCSTPSAPRWSQQAGTQQTRIAEALHGLSKELGSMASSSQESGPLTDLAHQASRKGGEIAHWLQDREPADVLEAVRSYAPPSTGHLLGAVRPGRRGGRAADPQRRRHPDQPGHQGRHRRLDRSALGGGDAATGLRSNYVTTPVTEPAVRRQPVRRPASTAARSRPPSRRPSYGPGTTVRPAAIRRHRAGPPAMSARPSRSTTRTATRTDEQHSVSAGAS